MRRSIITAFALFGWLFPMHLLVQNITVNGNITSKIQKNQFLELL